MLITGVVLAGLGWFGGYVIACWIWPFAACRKCEGAGKFRSPSGRAWRNCKRCKGSGKRVRGGVRVAEWLRGARKSLE
jgi:hypothetical protein